MARGPDASSEGSARPDIEFLDVSDPQSPEDDDVVEFGRRLPRWAVAAGCIVAGLAAVALVAALTSRSASPSGPPSASRSGPAPSAAISPQPQTTPSPVAGRVGPVLPVGNPAPPILDVSTGPDRLYVLSRARLAGLDAHHRVIAATTLSGSRAVAEGAGERMLLDAGSHRLWLLAAGHTSTRVSEFDADTLRPLRSLSVPERVLAAAVLSDHLYLGTSTGLADLAPGAAGASRVRSVHGPVSAIAADPTRGRLLAFQDATAAVNDSVPASLFAVTPRGSGHQPAVVTHDLGNLTGASFAIVRGQIWVGGVEAGQSGIGAAEIARLDPVSLAPVQTDAVALQVTKVVLTAGSADIWVSGPRPGLWCLDPFSGDILEHWTSVGIPLASRTGSAVVVRSGAVRPLVLDGCTG